MAISISPKGDINVDIRIHSLKDLKDLVGENIEVFQEVQHGGKIYTVLADEDGFLKSLPTNEYAFNKFEIYVYGSILLVDKRELKLRSKK